jgi:hypothetical protein
MDGVVGRQHHLAAAANVAALPMAVMLLPLQPLPPRVATMVGNPGQD